MWGTVWHACTGTRLYVKEGRAVLRLLVAQFLISAALSWTFGSVFDAYLYVISNQSNSFVGFVESIKGLTGLASAVPLGYLADVVPRRRLMRYAAWGACCIVVPASLGFMGQRKGWIIVGTVAFTIVSQCISGNLNALFADVTEPGEERARVMGWQGMVTQAGNCMGPLMQMSLLICVGAHNEWRPDSLGMCLAAGLALVLLLPLVVQTIPDQSLVVAESAHLENHHSSAEAATSTIPLANERSTASSPAPPPNNSQLPQWALRECCGGRLLVRWVVVVLLELSFVLLLFSTGLSVKYFPLFFKQDFGFGPAGIAALNAAFPFVVLIFIPICVWLSRFMGQVQGILIWTILGTFFMVILSMCEDASWAVLVFLLRNAFMKSRDPLFSALMMDCLEAQHRGRFGSVTSVRSATWAGSAWFGGLLLDHNNSNYRFIFRLTACLTTVPVALIVPLLCIVPGATVANEPASNSRAQD